MHLQQEQLVVEVVGNTEHADLTNEAHDLYCSQIAMPLWHVVVPRGLLRELSNRYMIVHYCTYIYVYSFYFWFQEIHDLEDVKKKTVMKH